MMIKKETSKSTVGEKIIKFIFIIFSIFFIVMLFSAVFFNKTVHANFKAPLMIIFSIMAFLILYLMNRKLKFRFWDKPLKVSNLIFIMLGIFVIQMLLANLTYAISGWDCGKVTQDAFYMYKGNDVELSYYFRYTNNIGLLLIFKYLLVIVGMFFNIELSSAFFIQIAFNILMIDIAAVFTFLTCKKLLGNKASYLSLVFLLPLMIFSPYMIIPYTDTITMAFPIVILYLYLILKEDKVKLLSRYLILIFIGILIVLGMLIKPTVIIVIIAIIMVEVLLSHVKQIKVQSIKSLALIILAVLIGGIIVNSAYTFLYNKNFKEKEEKYKEISSVPPTHFLMMGMSIKELEEMKDDENQKNYTLYGAYNEEDVLSILTIPNKKEKQEHDIKVAKERLKEYGVVGYLKFLYNKASWILGDGVFYYGGEGNFFTTEHFNKSKVGEFMQGFIDINSNKYVITAYINQTAWLLILLGLIFSYTKKTENRGIIVAKFSIIGIIMFVLMFEGRSRYLLNHISMFILVGTYGLQRIFNSLQKNMQKLKKTKTEKGS